MLKPEAHRTFWLHAILVAAVAAACFLQTVSFDFAFDDRPQILENSRIRSFSNLSKVFTENVWAFQGPNSVTNYYRPLHPTTYMVSYAISGLSPRTFHVTNIALHIFACLILLWIGRLLFRDRWIALWGALLFAAHPMHTENVAWVAGITDVGAGLFFFAAFGTYIKFRQAPNKSFTLLAASSLFFLCSLLYKETALTLPVILLLADVMLFPEDASLPSFDRWRDRCRRWLPYGAVLLLYLGLRINALGRFARVQNPVQLSLPDLIGTIIYFLGRYIQKLVLPIGQNAYYVFKPLSQLTVTEWLPPILIFLAGVILLWKCRKGDRRLHFLAAWFLVTISPVMAIRNVGANVFTERYLYIPSLGFCLLISALAGRNLPRRWSFPILGTVVLGLMAACIIRNPTWRDSKILFLRTVAASPDAAGIYNGLGYLYGKEGNMKEARQAFELGLAAYQRSFLKTPADKGGSYFGLSYVEESQGRLEEAYRLAEEGLKALPQDSRSHLIMARLLIKLGRLDEAEGHLRLSLQINPDNADAHVAFGSLLVLRNDWKDAESHSRAALRLDDSSFEARLVLGYVLQQTKRLSEALSVIKAAVASNPGNAAAQELLQEISKELLIHDRR